MTQPAMTNLPIPLIDLSTMFSDDAAARAELVTSIASACKDIGFFYITGHGLPDSLIEQAFGVSKKLFGLPSHEKETLDIHLSPYMRGYFSFGADKSDGIHGDVKEGFDLASDLSPDDPYVVAKTPFYGPNVWPPQIPEFRQVMTDYHTKLLGLGQRLLEYFALGLNMPADFFKSKFMKPMAQIRMLRYPPHVGTTGKFIGAGEHTDFGWITMIAQDETGGLEIQARSGKWLPVPFIPSSFVVNVGDLMARWTNDLYPATVHRVINRAARDRYSIAFFMDPDYHTTVECLGSCQSTAHPPKYPPIVVGDYMNHRFYETTTFRDLSPETENPTPANV